MGVGKFTLFGLIGLDVNIAEAPEATKPIALYAISIKHCSVPGSEEVQADGRVFTNVFLASA
jgi:hypothetical protein